MSVPRKGQGNSCYTHCPLDYGPDKDYIIPTLWSKTGVEFTYLHREKEILRGTDTQKTTEPGNESKEKSKVTTTICDGVRCHFMNLEATL